MGRSSGYRAKKGNKEQISKLRARLAECKCSQWQRATIIMREIVELTGKSVGPSGCSVEPRACKYCGRYGHTRQHCQKRLSDEEASMEALMLRCKQEDEERSRKIKSKEKVQHEWTQEAWFDQVGKVWERNPERWLMGPEVLHPLQDGGHGKWVRVNGTVKMADEWGRRILPVTARDVRS